MNQGGFADSLLVFLYEKRLPSRFVYHAQSIYVCVWGMSVCLLCGVLWLLVMYKVSQ